MNLPVTPMAGVRTVRELVLFRIKGKKRKQKYPPFIDTPEFPQLFDLPTNIQSCRSITSGPAHLTSKEKCQKYWHHQHKTHAASNDQDVGLSVALPKYRQGDWLNDIISEGYPGIHLTPRMPSSYQQCHYILWYSFWYVSKSKQTKSSKSSVTFPLIPKAF